MLEKLTVCVDLHGCPNRCRHCFLPHQKNPHLSLETLDYVAEYFKPYTQAFTLYGYTREPHFHADYDKQTQREDSLSTHLPKRFELISVYRLVRDKAYIKFLKTQSIKKAQITLFGCEALTDAYTGRPQAFKEIMQAVDLLMTHGICPRFQIILTKETLNDLPNLKDLLLNTIGPKLTQASMPLLCFVHTGSPIGNHRQHLNLWLTDEDIRKIPSFFIEKSKEHFNTESIEDFLGITETTIIKAHSSNENHVTVKLKEPIFYIDGNLDIYLHMTAYAVYSRLGNLKKDAPNILIDRYVNEEVLLMKLAKETPIKTLVKQGETTNRLFIPEDYFFLKLLEYTEKYQTINNEF